MDFRLTTEQIDIQRAAREFATGEFDRDAALEYDRNQQFPLPIWEKALYPPPRKKTTMY